MKTSEIGKALIKKYEGCKLNAYLCPSKIPTIGYGNTTYEDGSKVKIGDKITLKRAEELLDNLLPRYEKLVSKNIKVELNQNQFDALVSYVWNTGGSATLYKLINNKASLNDIKTWWLNKYITGGGKVLKGLVLRRKEEFDLYIK